LLFAGQVEWDRAVMEVDILLTRSDDVLIGTAFLHGCDVHLDYSTHVIAIERIA